MWQMLLMLLTSMISVDDIPFNAASQLYYTSASDLLCFFLSRYLLKSKQKEWMCSLQADSSNYCSTHA